MNISALHSWQYSKVFRNKFNFWWLCWSRITHGLFYCCCQRVLVFAAMKLSDHFGEKSRMIFGTLSYLKYSISSSLQHSGMRIANFKCNAPKQRVCWTCDTSSERTKLMKICSYRRTIWCCKAWSKRGRKHMIDRPLIIVEMSSLWELWLANRVMVKAHSKSTVSRLDHKYHLDGDSPISVYLAPWDV